MRALSRVTQAFTVSCRPSTNRRSCPKLVQQLERTVRGLGDAMQIEQAKSPVKRHGRKVVLFKDI